MRVITSLASVAASAWGPGQGSELSRIAARTQKKIVDDAVINSKRDDTGGRRSHNDRKKMERKSIKKSRAIDGERLESSHLSAAPVNNIKLFTRASLSRCCLFILCWS